MDTIPVAILAAPERRKHPRLLRQPTRAARRPWLRCRHCGQRLVQADVRFGATRLPVGRAYSDGAISLICPNCLTPRTFYPRNL